MPIPLLRRRLNLLPLGFSELFHLLLVVLCSAQWLPLRLYVLKFRQHSEPRPRPIILLTISSFGLVDDTGVISGAETMVGLTSSGLLGVASEAVCLKAKVSAVGAGDSGEGRKRAE